MSSSSDTWDSMDFYDNVCEVYIQTEGCQSGYNVKVVNDEGTVTYHVRKNSILSILRKLHDTVVNEGDIIADTDCRWSA